MLLPNLPGSIVLFELPEIEDLGPAEIVSQVEASVLQVPPPFDYGVCDQFRPESHTVQAVHRAACFFYFDELLQQLVIVIEAFYRVIAHHPEGGAQMAMPCVAASGAAELLVASPVQGFSALQTVRVLRDGVKSIHSCLFRYLFARAANMALLIELSKDYKES